MFWIPSARHWGLVIICLHTQEAKEVLFVNHPPKTPEQTVAQMGLIQLDTQALEIDHYWSLFLFSNKILHHNRYSQITLAKANHKKQDF